MPNFVTGHPFTKKLLISNRGGLFFVCVFSLNQVGLPYFLGTVDILELYIVKSKNVKTPSLGEIKTFRQQALLHWVFREEPTRQVSGAQMLAQGEKNKFWLLC